MGFRNEKPVSCKLPDMPISPIAHIVSPARRMLQLKSPLNLHFPSIGREAPETLNPGLWISCFPHFGEKCGLTAPLSRRVCYPAAMEKRIIKLETLVAMQDETIGKLNEEIFRQQQDIARLQRRIEAIGQKMAELGDPEPVAGNERPPHY